MKINQGKILPVLWRDAAIHWKWEEVNYGCNKAGAEDLPFCTL